MSGGDLVGDHKYLLQFKKHLLGLRINFSVVASYMDPKCCVLKNLEVKVTCNEELCLMIHEWLQGQRQMTKVHWKSLTTITA